jgi:amino acid transporter
MSVPVHEYQPSRVETALAAERLGTSSVLGYVLSGVAPLTVAAGLITVAFAVTGITGIPFTLAVVVFFLCLFAVGFLSMAKYVSNAGAFYSYVARGLGRPFGVGAAVVAFGAYNCLQVALYGIFGVTAASMFAEHFGSQHSWWFWALVAWVVVAVLGTRDVKWVSAVLAVCIVAETIVILALSLDGLVHPAATGGGYTGALSPSGLSIATFSIAGAVAVLCFVGFEVAPVYREEAKHATWTIITATGIALLSMLVTYGLAAWALVVHYGQSHVVETAQKLGPEMLFQLGGTSWLADAGRWLFLSSLFAAMMAFHAAVTRYTYVLGRERAAPGVFDRINKAKAPWVASVFQSSIGLGVIALYAVKHWDPTVQLFFWLGQTGGFLVIGLLALTSVAVFWFYQREFHRRSIWIRIVAPLVSAGGLGWLFYQVWVNYSLLLGEQSPSLASRLLPASSVVLFGVGLARAGWLYAFKRDVYRRVGHDESVVRPVEFVLPPLTRPTSEVGG